MSDHKPPAIRFTMNPQQEIALATEAARYRKRKGRDRIDRCIDSVMPFGCFWFIVDTLMIRFIDVSQDQRWIISGVIALILSQFWRIYENANPEEVRSLRNFFAECPKDQKEVELRDDLLFVRIGDLAWGVGWKSVNQILSYKSAIVVIIDSDHFLFIPRSAFDSTEQQQQFLDDLRRICREGGGPEGLAVHLACPKCSYDLFGALDDCPECGNKVPAVW